MAEYYCRRLDVVNRGFSGELLKRDLAHVQDTIPIGKGDRILLYLPQGHSRVQADPGYKGGTRSWKSPVNQTYDYLAW